MAMSLARSFERRNTAAAAAHQPQALLPAPPTSRSPPPQSPLLALPAATTSAATPTTQPPKLLAQSSSNATTVVAGRIVRRLTLPKIDERRRLGLCFNCDERYVRGHNCSCKKLFLLDVDYDDADDTEDTEDLKVSMLAVTGIHQDKELSAPGFTKPSVTPVKPVRPGSGLVRYQIGPNLKFKFKFKKMKNY
jgi:hypothetical protein